MRKLKESKKITYRWGTEVLGPVPCIIIEGRWIEEKYGLKVGDTIGIKYSDKAIALEIRASPKVVYEQCEVCGRKLKRKVPEGQTSIVGEKFICGNCINRKKEKEKDTIIMEMRGQRRLF